MLSHENQNQKQQNHNKRRVLSRDSYGFAWYLTEYSSMFQHPVRQHQPAPRPHLAPQKSRCRSGSFVITLQSSRCCALARAPTPASSSGGPSCLDGRCGRDEAPDRRPASILGLVGAGASTARTRRRLPPCRTACCPAGAAGPSSRPRSRRTVRNPRTGRRARS
jgi:hypothetical protein